MNDEEIKDLRIVSCPECGADMGWDDTKPEPCDRCMYPGEAGALYAFMGWLTGRKKVSGPFSR